MYAGTERGMFISYNDGTSWQPFQLNLLIVPITDLALKNNNLIAATQGRSLWMIDDLTFCIRRSPRNLPLNLSCLNLWIVTE
ncbi:MAG: hypothetical protein IPL55_07995 [Saprospiraceae bacterium]|nr:hypothetical protein [Saprospiraceae bacterium]